MSWTGISWRLLLAFLASPPIALGMLALAVLLHDSNAFAASDPEGIGYLIAFALMTLPPLFVGLLATLPLVLKPSGGARLPTTIAAILLCSLTCTALWAAVVIVGVGSFGMSPLTLLLPFLEGTVGGGILAGLISLQARRAVL